MKGASLPLVGCHGQEQLLADDNGRRIPGRGERNLPEQVMVGRPIDRITFRFGKLPVSVWPTPAGPVVCLKGKVTEKEKGEDTGLHGILHQDGRV
jgi:hypothetical protein